jgi:hypothetical protein
MATHCSRISSPPHVDGMIGCFRKGKYIKPGAFEKSSHTVFISLNVHWVPSG